MWVNFQFELIADSEEVDNVAFLLLVGALVDRLCYYRYFIKMGKHISNSFIIHIMGFLRDMNKLYIFLKKYTDKHHFIILRLVTEYFHEFHVRDYLYLVGHDFLYYLFQYDQLDLDLFYLRVHFVHWNCMRKPKNHFF